MSGKRAAIIVNPTRVSVEELEAVLPALEARHGYGHSLIIETTVDDAGFTQTRAAMDADVALIIAAGGDGTVRLAAEALAGTTTPLAIVPAGTGNLLARNLDIPTPWTIGSGGNLADALELAFTGHDRQIDLARVDVERPSGEIETFVFSVIAGLGIDAGMIANTDETLKERIGWLAYGIGIGRWLLSSGRFRARYRIDQERTWGTLASTIMIANASTLTGGMVLMPEARIDDGRIDMVIMRPKGPLGWAQVTASVLTRRIERFRSRSNHTVGFYQGREIRLRIDSRPEEFQVDGDAIGPVVAARFRAMPGAICVRTPSQ